MSDYMRYFLFVILILATAPSHATYSIVASNSANKQVGIAMASCVEIPLWIATGSAPGAGLLAAQADPNIFARADGQIGLLFGAPINEILSYITDPSYDPNFAVRQYGIVDTNGNAAAFTGANTDPYSGDKQGKVSTYAYTVQGNILTGPEVIQQAADAFENSGCDLADKLMKALMAGAKGGGGDSRCTPSGRPASRAYIQVDRGSDRAVPGSYLAIDTGYTDRNPLGILKREYNKWRQTHGCPKTGSKN